MFGFSWAETLVILVVALLVIGPEELPQIVRWGVKLVRRLKELGRELSNSFQEVLDASGVNEVNEVIRSEGQKLKKIVDLEGIEREVYDMEDIKHLLNQKPPVSNDITPDITPTNSSNKS